MFIYGIYVIYLGKINEYKDPREATINIKVGHETITPTRHYSLYM